MSTKVETIAWTPAAVAWWRENCSLFGPDAAEKMLQIAKSAAGKDGRAVVGRNDLEAARVQVEG